MKVYTYNKCSTCRKATKWLSEHGIEFDEISIRETPPTENELKLMLEAFNGEIKKLFNTSGQDYRNLGIKNKLKEMSVDEVFTLLASNGNLVKRPFLLSDQWKTVGFKDADWETHLT